MGDAYAPRDGRTAVLVVDVTRSLSDPDVEGSYEPCVAAADRIGDLLGTARSADLPVFFSHGGLNYFTSEGVDLAPVERCGWPRHTETRDEPPERGELHYEILPSLHPESGVVVDKTAPSVFFETPLHTYLSSLGVRRVVVTGMMTSACVRASVVDAFSHTYDVVVPREAVADRRPDAHEYHLEEMDGKYASVEPIEDVLETLRT